MIKTQPIKKETIRLFKIHIGFCLTVFALTFLITQTGLSDLNVPIKGKVKSYSDGIYTIEANKSLVRIKDQSLTLELKRTLHRRIGRQVQITVPHHAIQPNKPTRTQASIKEKGTLNKNSKSNK